MAKFEKVRKDMIKKKNEVWTGKENLTKEIEKYDEHRTEVEDGISKIPKDLPQEVQKDVDRAVEKERQKLKKEADKIEKKVDKVSEKADKAMDMAEEKATDFKQQAEKVRSLRDIPVLGSFIEQKAETLDDYAQQMTDLRQETQKYQDELQHAKIKLTNKK